jgi:spore maturation protein CgeB
MKQYRVLLIAAFGNPWNDSWFYKTGFEQNGHTVLAYDPKGRPDARAEILALVRDFRPDIAVHTKDELPAADFEMLRQNVKVIQWYPDPVIPGWLTDYVRACDIFFTMSEGLVNDFRKLNAQSYWLSQAFEPSAFTVGTISDEDRREFSADLTFVGNLGSKPQYAVRRTFLERVLKEGMALKWWGPRIPWKLSNLALQYGRVGRAYGGRFVWGEEHAKIARLSKIYLGFDSQPHIRKSMSERMYIAVGCGAFYLCRHVPGIEEVLLPDREIVTFHTGDEMIDKIRFYLSRDDLRKRIAEAGRTRVLKDHTYETRIRQMCGLIEKAG